jgi:DUF3017 family protein
VIERLLRRVRGQVPFLAVLALTAAAFGYLLIWPDHWRRGVGAVALAMIAAGVLRIVLPQQRAGLLRVRSRWLDVACYLSAGVAILVAAIGLG